jgi:hypothetical protein
MRAIDSPHKITPRKVILRQETQNVSIFASIHTSIFLNQGQGSIFTLRECAQSIFRLEITLKSRFLEENRKKIFALKRSSTLIFRVKLNFSLSEKIFQF